MEEEIVTFPLSKLNFWFIDPFDWHLVKIAAIYFYF